MAGGMLEIAEAMRRAGVEHRVLDDAWCAAREREAPNDEERHTFGRGVRGLAEAETENPEVLEKVAAMVELAGGDVRLLFDADGRYLGVSTTHVDRPGFRPRDREIRG